MTTKADIVKRLKAENPKAFEYINDEPREIVGAEYDALVDAWAEAELAKAAEDLAVANAKAALYARLGITEDEAKLLLS